MCVDGTCGEFQIPIATQGGSPCSVDAGGNVGLGKFCNTADQYFSVAVPCQVATVKQDVGVV